jgi:nicotinate phosphoribosyltransferase
MAHGLYTDLYELRMVASYLKRGMSGPATFSLYIRPTPERGWFIAHGVDYLLDFLDEFRFEDEDLAYLRGLGFDDATLSELAKLEPHGEVWAVPDGTMVLANEPILEVTAPLPFAQLVETAAINLVQLPTLVATKAARMALAAAGRPVVDFGFRRAHGLETGVAASLAAFVGGGLATSNVEAARRYGIPAVGTMAHSYVQAYRSEIEAFRAYAEDFPDSTILLVDTYDTLKGVQNAVVVARELRANGHELRGIRLDSGDLATLARESRVILDDSGFPEVQIFASGGLDENDIADLVRVRAPIDSFGVGTDLAVSRDVPAVDIVYKLVDFDGRPVSKLSTGKETLPGEKQVFRADGGITDDVLGLRDDDEPGALLERAWQDGMRSKLFDPATARGRAAEALAVLPPPLRKFERFESPPVPRLSARLEDLARS